MAVPPMGVFDALRRETAMTLDPDGTVAWVDARGAGTLGLTPGMSLRDVVAPGAAPKVGQFLETAAREPVASWELVFLVGGVPTPAVLHATPHEGRIAAVANTIAHSVEQLVADVSQMVGELSTLHRESERQQREIVEQRADIDRLSGELTDSGRGMESLYAELDESADTLRNTSENRTRFMASMGHELRTPLNSILGLAKLLLSRIDGDLTPEQEKQLGFIRQSAEALSEIVNDLLDLAKIEAGRAQLRPSEFTATGLFSALRGMMRPLATNPDVSLVFDDVAHLPPLNTDHGKLAQILRNLVSNALKYTERGEVRVSAVAGEDGGTITFGVRDTGVGIAPEDLPRIFDEFTQVENPLQAKTKGTGLGLTISKRLAKILAGEITVESTPGQGSVFFLTIPRVHDEVTAMRELVRRSDQLDPTRSPVLVVEDDRQTLFLYEKYLEGSGFQVIPVRDVEAARRVIRRTKPAAVVLDVFLDGETSWSFLAELKKDPLTCDIPTLVVTVMDREQKARALGADEFYVKPLDREWLLRKLRTFAARGPLETILVIDDDDVHRYLVRRLLADTPYRVLEAADGPEGVRKATESLPDLIFLDFVMPSMTAFEVLDELKADPRTRAIPVIVATSKQLDAQERRRLAEVTTDVISKEKLSREVAISRIREALTKAVGNGRGRGGTAGSGAPKGREPSRV